MHGDRPELSGPFDIVGDVHGCLGELRALLGRLGWRLDAGAPAHPAGRTAIFVGDLVDRGPASAAVLQLVMEMVGSGAALAVPGNHDVRLVEALTAAPGDGDGREGTGLAELRASSPSFRAAVASFVGALPGHLRLHGGRLIVAHAGLREELHEDFSEASRRVAVFGEHDGVRPDGRLRRRDWAAGYRGRAIVVHGHTRVPWPRWRNRTIDVDTGCVRGGRLTALRYPELELLSVAAERRYAGRAEGAAATLDGASDVAPQFSRSTTIAMP
jgi:protein phosphatase